MKAAVALLVFALTPFTFAQTPEKSPRPLVVELFTSEGCSSCPPADALLGQLEKQASFQGRPIIVLGEHVDYWNGLGWHDRFSSAAFTQRQNEYARRLGIASIYTPQMIVNGRTEFVGNDPDALQKAFAAPDSSPADPVTLEVSRDNVAHISVTNTPRGSHVFLAITETNLTTAVRAGENKNRELHHAGVVRQLRDLGKTNGTFSASVPLKLDPAWNRANIRVIAFTQQGDAGRIDGAASVPLP
jgi:hypothetical protein